MSIIGQMIEIADERLPHRVLRVRGDEGADRRRIMAVRYPWDGWGDTYYARRSLIDSNRRSGLSVEPEPSRENMARKILNVVNSNRLVLEARFTSRAETAYSRMGGGFNQEGWFEPGYEPRLATSGNRTVAPMSDTSAFFEFRTIPGSTHIGRDRRVLAMYNDLSPVMHGGFIDYESDDEWNRGPWAHSDERTRMAGWFRKCTRICVYRDIDTETLSFDNETWGGFNASSPDFIGRHKANAESAGDNAYEPWGFTDIVPNDLPGNDYGLYLRYQDYHFSPYNPAPPGYSHGGDGPVNANADVSTLSRDHIMYMFGHFCRPWLDGKKYMGLYYSATPGEHGGTDRSEAFWPMFFPARNKKITIVVEAVFYGYAIRELQVAVRDDGYVAATGYNTIARGYGGAYGRAFMIF